MDRHEPAFELAEREMLCGWLDYHRATLAWKCEGLTEDQLRQQAVPPSPLSLLGLVRHMAEVELGWFRRGVAREDIWYHWITDDREDADFEDVDTADVSEAFNAWEQEIAKARTIVDQSPTLDATFERHHDATRISVRWVLSHMIEEYARHNGHADLLRERIDGSTGS